MKGLKSAEDKKGSKREEKAEREARVKLAGLLIKSFGIHIPSRQFDSVPQGSNRPEIFEYFLSYTDRIVSVEGRAIVNFSSHTVCVCIERLRHHHGNLKKYYLWRKYDMGIDKKTELG